VAVPRVTGARTSGGVLLAVSLALTATVSGASAQSTPEVERLTVAYNAFENNITPFTLTMQSLPNTPDLVYLVHDTLFWSPARDEPRPLLAESAEPNEDLTAWTVTLRQDVTWHDGEPFTAEDVAFTYRYFTDVHRMGRFAHHVYDIPPFESADVIDDHTVELTFAEPAPTFVSLPGADVPIVPQHIWEDIDEPGLETEMLPVGTGPFELVEIEPDQLYRFSANADYFLGPPSVEELVLPIVQDPSSVFAGLRTGELDSAVHPIPPELVEDFDADDEIEIGIATRMETVILYFNTQREPQSDPVLRKALALAIDRDEIVDRVMLGHAQPGLDSFTHPESVWATPDPVRDHDVDRAADLLEGAGYELDDGGTLLTPDGDPVEIEVLVSSFAPQHLRAMELAAEDAAELGIQMRIEPLDPATIASRRGPTAEEDAPPVDAFVRAMEAHMHVDPDAMIHFFGTPQPGRPGAGLSGYANPDLDELAMQAATETDPGTREEMVHELQAMFAEEVPAIALYYPTAQYAYRPAAYDGWHEEPGHGIFNKFSFVAAEPEEAGTADGAATPDAADEDEAEQTAGDQAAGAETELVAAAPWPWIVLGVLIVALIVAPLALRRRRSEADAYE
jgi:peptide/nickel transport system substrate-binding protein